MGAGAAYSVLSMEQAIKDSGLTPEEVSNPKTGLIAGSGGPSTLNLLQSFDDKLDNWNVLRKNHMSFFVSQHQT